MLFSSATNCIRYVCIKDFRPICNFWRQRILFLEFSSVFKIREFYESYNLHSQSTICTIVVLWWPEVVLLCRLHLCTFGDAATAVIGSCFYRAMLCIRGTSHGPVSVSVTSRCSIETAERIELVFGVWSSFRPSYTVLKRNSVISKNIYGHFPLELCPELRTWKISPRHIDRRNVFVIGLVRERWTLCRAW